ncbi:unnamed protein product, partial [Effrenium voratum]
QLDTALAAAASSAIARRREWEKVVSLDVELRNLRLGGSVGFCSNTLQSLRHDWRKALQLVGLSLAANVRPDPLLGNGLLAACDESSGEAVLRQLPKMQLQVDVVSFNSVLSSLSWHRGWALVQRMRRQLQEPDAVSRNCLCAVSDGYAWRWALSAACSAAKEGLSSAAAGLSRIARWPLSLALLAGASAKCTQLDVASFNVQVTALARGLRWQAALQLGPRQ